MRSYDLTDGKEPISYAEIDYLKSLVRSLPPNPVIVQIGAGSGIFSVATLEERSDAMIFSVDCLACSEEFQNVAAAGLDSSRIVRLLGYSQDVGPNFPYQCDMIFIDGDHFGADKDIETWIRGNKVKPGGIIAFHDYQEVCAPNNPGNVYDCVNSGMAEYVKIGRAERVVAFRNEKKEAAP